MPQGSAMRVEIQFIGSAADMSAVAKAFLEGEPIPAECGASIQMFADDRLPTPERLSGLAEPTSQNRKRMIALQPDPSVGEWTFEDLRQEVVRTIYATNDPTIVRTLLELKGVRTLREIPASEYVDVVLRLRSAVMDPARGIFRSYNPPR